MTDVAIFLDVMKALFKGRTIDHFLQPRSGAIMVVFSDGTSFTCTAVEKEKRLGLMIKLTTDKQI
jgi:hypothetical protein